MEGQISVQKEVDKLKGFKRHGVDFTGETPTQAYGTCPFTGKQKKFYVNKKTLLWDSKVTGQKGNFKDFLTEISSQQQLDVDPRFLKRLCTDRGLPAQAFKRWNLGRSGNYFTLPGS